MSEEKLQVIADALLVLLSDLANDGSLSEDTRINASECHKSLEEDLHNARLSDRHEQSRRG